MLMFCNQVANCRRKVTGKSRFVFAIYKDIYTSIVQQEASGRSVTEYMMDGVSFKDYASSTERFFQISSTSDSPSKYGNCSLRRNVSPSGTIIILSESGYSQTS